MEETTPQDVEDAIRFVARSFGEFFTDLYGSPRTDPSTPHGDVDECDLPNDTSGPQINQLLLLGAA